MSELRERVRETRAAGARLAALGGEGRAAILRDLAAALRTDEVRTRVLAANQEDLERARKESVAAPLLARLGLDGAKLDSLADGLLQLAGMADPVGRVTLRRELDDDLVLTRVSCPLGVLAAVFEARPDALIQIVGLAWKSGNAVLLKGGREARSSNRALAEVAAQVLARNRLPAAATLLLEDRAQVAELLALDDLVDLVVARGSNALVTELRAATSIPVMGHAAGVCHLYLHRGADPRLAARVAVDGKCSYPSACNATETLLWDEGAGAALDACVAALQARGVELRADDATRARHPDLAPAAATDFGFEFGNLTLAVKQVRDLDEALSHIERYGSRHTESIVTTDAAAAERFLASVDAASVFHDVSTRFADGYRYGLGAEVGISTDKLHARGPVGVEGLLTYRWMLRGSGQVTTDYGPGKRRFAFRDGGGPIAGIDHVQVAIPVGGEDRARGFYGAVLGMQEIPKPAALAVRGGLWLQCGSQQLHIGVESAHVPARKAHPALRVRRFDEVLGRLQAAGVAFRRDEEIPGVRRGFCDDPFGNRVELIEDQGVV